MEMEKALYRFDPICNRNGLPTKYQHRFTDEQDFRLNPKLLTELRLDTCQETTPEGKALWLYLRLCQVLKYDESYFFRDSYHHPNHDPYQSFKIVEDVTAETPVTCFNFSRIAVKLMNQIPGVHALIIAVGENEGHFRFGYYTNQVSVDAEATTSSNHYNDLARVKLGIKPQGLVIFNGYEMMQDLAQRIIPPMLAQSQQGLQQYLKVLHDCPAKKTNLPQIEIEALVSNLKKNGVDGASTTQLLFNMNKKFSQPPYRFLRMGLMSASGQMQPQLLVREGQKITQIDLRNMQVSNLSVEQFKHMVHSGELIYADNTLQNYKFEGEISL